MFFVAHEYIVRQAVNQVNGFDRRLFPAIVLGSYFPDIQKLPITQFYKGYTHAFSHKANSIRHTPQANAYALGWRLHILADFFWHKGIYDPLKGPICASTGTYDPIRHKRMSLKEHVMREIALDLYIFEHTGNTAWGNIGNLALRELFYWKNLSSEIGFWCYKQIAKSYAHRLPNVQGLVQQGIPRRLARSYKFIKKMAPSVDNMLEEAIEASARVLRRYLEAE